MEKDDDRVTVARSGRQSRLRRRVSAAAVALAAALAVGAAAALPPAAPPATARSLGEVYFGPRTARAEVVNVVGSAVEDIRIDQGRLLSASASSIIVLERDGTRQTIAIGPATQVYGRGLAARGKPYVIAIREGDGPAQSVYTSAAAATSPLTPRAMGQIFLGPRLARAEVVLVAGAAVHDVRIDQGRVVSVTPTALVVLERDGTQQSIPVSAVTEVWLGNQQADLSALQQRMNVLTIREGNQPAQSVRAGAVRVQGQGGRR